ncbi:MAG: hypothetical protein ACRD0Y_11675 [Terriglobales bacterium]
MIIRIAFALALVSGLVAARPFYGWTQFFSAKYKYAAYYPPGWHLLQPTGDSLTAINFPDSQRVTGAVIPEQGAYIDAGPVSASITTVNDAVMQALAHADGAPILEQTLLTSDPGTNGCPTLHQLEYYENFGSSTKPVLEHWTSYFCSVHGRIFAVDLGYWRGNKDAALLEGLARTVANTLQIYPLKVSSGGQPAPPKARARTRPR